MNRVAMRIRILDLSDCLKAIHRVNKDGKYNNVISELLQEKLDLEKRLENVKR